MSNGFLEVGDTIRIFNRDEIKAYIDAGGDRAFNLEKCICSWNTKTILVEYSRHFRAFRTKAGWFVPEELAEFLR